MVRRQGAALRLPSTSSRGRSAISCDEAEFVPTIAKKLLDKGKTYATIDILSEVRFSLSSGRQTLYWPSTGSFFFCISYVARTQKGRSYRARCALYHFSYAHRSYDNRNNNPYHPSAH